MKKYIAIHADEDGNPISFLTRAELEEQLETPEDWGITGVLEDLPEEENPQYWQEGLTLFAEIKILKPKEIVKKVTLEL